MELSLIIPTRNRANSLRRTLESIGMLDCDRESSAYEVILVDNGSTDETRVVFQQVRERLDGKDWRYEYEPMPGLLSGRHRGVAVAGGEVCAFLDDDVRLGKKWLEALVASFNNPAIQFVGGPSEPIYETPPPKWLSGFWKEAGEVRWCSWLSLINAGRQPRFIDLTHLYGLNYAVRKSTLLRFGGFHPDCLPRELYRYLGDGESGLSRKAQKEGFKMFYHPDAAVEHEIGASRLTVGYFEDRAYYQGASDSYLQIRNMRQAPIVRSSWTMPFREIKRSIERKMPVVTQTHEAVLKRTTAAYYAGFRFHQSEVARDPRLLDWVLRENYIDYHLPDGWRGYLRTN